MHRTVAWGLGLLGLLFFLACAGLGFLIETVFWLAFGWVAFLMRVGPRIRVGGPAALTGLVCLVLFAAGSHAFLDWLYGQGGTKTETDLPAPRRWKPRWTASLVAVIVLMFVAGIATAGMAHQVGWLLTSREPLLGSGMRQFVQRAQSTNNLKQIGLGLVNYHEDRGSYPPGGTFDAEGRPRHGWQAMILPYVEQEKLYGRIDFDIPWDDAPNAPAYRTRLSIYERPGIPVVNDPAAYAPSHYAGNVHLLGGVGAKSDRDVTDGTSSTLMAGEAAGRFKPWGDPTNWRDPALGINRTPEGFGSPFPGGANFLFADGSVRFLKQTVDPAILEALGTPAGKEKVSADDY